MGNCELDKRIADGLPLHVVGFKWTQEEMAHVLKYLIGSIGYSRAPVVII